MAFSSKKRNSLLTLLFLTCVPLTCLCQTTNSSTISPPTNSSTISPSTNSSTISPSTNSTTISSNITSLKGVRGCGNGLNPIYRYLCDRRAAWGIVLETLASAGFLLSVGLLLGLLLWTLCTCMSSRHQHNSFGGMVLCMSMFLLATAGIFAITFAFIIRLTPQTCPTRLFLFSVLFSLAFSCLLARCLALLGFAAARGWGEPAVALGLFIVQVIISTEWMLIVLVRDKKPCEYSQEEFVMLQIFVLCLLAISLILSLHILCRSCFTYSYSYSGPTSRQWRTQAMLLCLTLLLSACIWVVWITMLTWGNPKLGRRPVWDDPVLSIALVANGWVLLMGQGLSQVASFCKGEATSRDLPLNFAGWTSPNADIPGLASQKEGKENGSFENDGETRRETGLPQEEIDLLCTVESIESRSTDPKLRSPYESGFSMTEIDPDKDYTIPRPKTTNYTEPYDDYYGQD
ncbi:retinoic acid-induced protein 3 isoform X1 [Leuresthes tenuis]|uniref:retinoic acid-induced protein 3 isoform X1 n=1 Tax=Leuresthes tenuis TaxID=355514 RepID=UPI003B5035AB